MAVSAGTRLLDNDCVAKWVLIAPLMLFLFAFMLAPVLFSLCFSFTGYVMQDAPQFVGLDNYRHILSGSVLWTTLGRTVYVLFWCVFIELVLGMLLALLLNRAFAGRRIVQTLCFIPLLVSPLSMALMWKHMLHAQFGVVNTLLGYVGVDPVPFLSEHGYALNTIIFITVWHWLPFSTFVLLAGLGGMPRDQLEAARIDGSTPTRTFFRLTLPTLAPLIVIIVLLRTMWLLRLFDPIHGTTRGEYGTGLLDWMIYRAAFVFHDIGQGTAYAMFALFVTLIFGALMFKRLIRAVDRA